jgi:hypothetical protein
MNKDDFWTQKTKTYVAAALADVFTGVVMCGVNGEKVNFGDVFTLSLQTGTEFVAYGIGTHFLEKYCEFFRQAQREKNYLVTYGSRALAAGGILAVVNYPLSKIYLARTGQKVQYSPSDFGWFFAEKVLANTGFPVVMDTLEHALPTTKHSLFGWARSHACVEGGALGAAVARLPLKLARTGEGSLASTVTSWIKGIGAGICLDDASAHFSGLLKSLN